MLHHFQFFIKIPLKRVHRKCAARYSNRINRIIILTFYGHITVFRFIFSRLFGTLVLFSNFIVLILYGCFIPFCQLLLLSITARFFKYTAIYCFSVEKKKHIERRCLRSKLLLQTRKSHSFRIFSIHILKIELNRTK